MDFSGIIVAAIAALASFGGAYLIFRKGRDENQNKANEIKLALDKAIDDRVDAQLKGAWEEIDGLKKHREEDRVKIQKLEETVNNMTAERREMNTTMVEMVEHIEGLEKLVPDPPGVPRRPDWLKNLASSQA